jgi:exopolysaccharide production protein ExoZ
MQRQTYFYLLDAIRFCAAFMVCLFHLVFEVGAPSGIVRQLSGGAINFEGAYDWTHFGWVGVQVFFIVSGFVIAFSASASSPRQFLIGRVARLVPAMWICAPITLIALLFSGIPLAQLASPVARSMLFFPAGPWIDGAHWTLGIEISFYLAILLLVWVGRFDRIVGFAYFLIGASLAFWVMYHVTRNAALPISAGYFQKRFVELLLITHGASFAVGILLWSRYVRKQVSNAQTTLIWLGLVATGLQILANHQMNQPHVPVSTHWAPLVCWGVMTAALILAIKYNHAGDRLPNATKKMLRLAGLTTYPFYLLHQNLGAVFLRQLVEFGFSRYAALAIDISALVALCAFIATKIEPAFRVLFLKSLNGSARVPGPAQQKVA